MTYDLAATDFVLAITHDLCDQSYALSTICPRFQHFSVAGRSLYSLFEEIWEKEDIPAELKEGYLIKIPKKGNRSRCENFRWITILSVPGKVLNIIILERMKGEVDKTLREEQAGFRQDRSCTDQIATLRIIVEQSTEWKSSQYVNFVDYEKAFDSLDREKLWKILRHYGVPMKLVKTHMRECHAESSMTVN